MLLQHSTTLNFNYYIIEPSTYPLPAFNYIGSSFLLVEWSPPTVPNGLILHYTLYINYSSSSNVSVSFVDSQFNIFFINNLTQNQLVGVSISASTVAGEGPPSPFVFTTTISGMLFCITFHAFMYLLKEVKILASLSQVCYI